MSVETGPIAPRPPAPPTAYKQSADQALIAELRRLENAQADLLLDHFGAVQPSHRLLDAGSGRGGTSFMANRRFGCAVDGVSISQAQVRFANGEAAARGVVPVTVTDLTRDTIPYWKLRAASSIATGVEDAVLTAYREGSFHYLLIVADYIGW